MENKEIKDTAVSQADDKKPPHLKSLLKEARQQGTLPLRKSIIL